MTPKEKAKELYSKFYTIPIVKNNKKYHYHIGDVIKNSAKQMKDKTNHIKVCALLCVDEIISSGLNLIDYRIYSGDKRNCLNYWQEIKQEIKKLKS